MGFIEGTKILCIVNGNEVYLPIQELKHGTLVKTLKSGVKRVEMIGSNTMRTNEENIKEQFFKYTNEYCPEITEDLIMIGGHSRLIDSLTPEQNEQTVELSGDLSLVEGKYRLMACLDSRAQEVSEEGNYTIWYLVLENVYRLKNYGIYANGLLVESTSKDSLSKDPTITLIPYSGPPIRATFGNPIYGNKPFVNTLDRLNRFS